MIEETFLWEHSGVTDKVGRYSMTKNKYDQIKEMLDTVKL